MIFLIANMCEKIPANPLKTRGQILSNRQIFGVCRGAAPTRYPENGTARQHQCAKMMRSTKGEFVPA
jgi:hypothetical protein